MITTQKPQEKEMTLFELLKTTHANFGLDICDNIYDIGACLCIDLEKDTIEKCEDYYDKLMLLIALNLKVIKPKPNYYTICKITEFITDNIKAFEEFCNETYREEYQPQYLLSQGHKVNDPYEDDWFYEVYLEDFDKLLAGYFSENSYRKLFELLIKYGEEK